MIPNQRLQQRWDEERKGGGGVGGSDSKPQERPQPGKTRDQAQEEERSKTTEEWENDKFPKSEQ